MSTASGTDGVLAFAYDLPFAVHLTSPSSLAPLTAQIEFQRELSEEDISNVEAALSVFFTAAAYGMLAGGQVHPVLLDDPEGAWERCLRVSRASPRAVRCEMQEVTTDVHSLVVLLNLLLCFSEQFLPIDSLHLGHAELKSSGPSHLRKAASTSYPEPFAHLPFTYENAALGTWFESVTLTMLFQRPCTDSQLELLRGALEAWSDLAAAGGYISPPASHEGGYPLSPDEQLTVWDSEVQWSIEKYRIDEEALTALVNFLVALHDKGCQLSALCIE